MLKSRLLVLDDDSTVAQTIHWIAESVGFDVRSVSTPAAFFAEVEQWLPEFIALDLAMPELDGVEIMNLLSDQGCRARIIVTSGMGGRILDAARRSATQHGLDILGVLPKPLTRQNLSDLVAGLTARESPQLVQPCATQQHQFVPTLEELRRALEKREFVVAYQPKIDCTTKALAGFEALVRWQHPERGTIFPDSFIQAAEESLLIDRLTEQVFDQGLEWLSGIPSPIELGLALNISAKSLGDFRLADRFSALCSQFSIAPERIVLELTETSAIVDPLLSLDVLTRFRMKGFKLSIDGFGTGFSSMVQLVRLPFSEIKVDKGFVISALQFQESRAVTKCIVDLGHSLGLSVVAEGVEDRQTLDWIKSLGCDFFQGYYVARPMLGIAASEWTGNLSRGCVPKRRLDRDRSRESARRNLRHQNRPTSRAEEWPESWTLLSLCPFGMNSCRIVYQRPGVVRTAVRRASAGPEPGPPQLCRRQCSRPRPER